MTTGNNLVWHKAHMGGPYGFDIESEVMPGDGVWRYWKFKDGTVLKARLKYDCQDHFWPPCQKDEEDIVAWAEIPEGYDD